MKSSKSLSVPSPLGLCALALSALTLGAADKALAADGHVQYLHELDDYERPLLLAASDRGVVFIGADHQLYRAYHHEQRARDGVTQPFLWVEDIDSDQSVEIVAAGHPSFAIETNGDPLWGILDGCDQTFVGDFFEDDRAEIFCRRDNSVKVWNFRGQEVLEWRGRGYNLGDCYVADTDGDRELEATCVLGEDRHMSFDLDFDEPEVVDYAARSAFQSGLNLRRVSALASGDSVIRANGREINLGFNAGTLTLSEAGAAYATLTLDTSAIYSAQTADLGRDGSKEIYIGGDDKVFVVSTDGTLLGTVNANPTATTRTPVVELRTVTAVGLEDSSRETTRALYDAQQSAFDGCYAASFGSNQFTRVGTMLFELSIDEDGDVSRVNMRHSDLGSSSLESCIEGILEDMTFSAGTEDSANSSVQLSFSFTDR